MNTLKAAAPALALALAMSAPASAGADAPAAADRAPAKVTLTSNETVQPKASPDEEWGIWNQAPSRGNRDPLLALGYRDRAPGPEPIDAAARGEDLPTDGTANRNPIELNATDLGELTAPPPPNPADGR